MTKQTFTEYIQGEYWTHVFNLDPTGECVTISYLCSDLLTQAFFNHFDYDNDYDENCQAYDILSNYESRQIIIKLAKKHNINTKCNILQATDVINVLSIIFNVIITKNVCKQLQLKPEDTIFLDSKTIKKLNSISKQIKI